MNEANLDALFESLRKYGLVMHRCRHGIKSKPLIGRSFPIDQFRLGSMLHMDSGLYEVQYLVYERDSGFPISSSGAKGEAIAAARNLLTKYPDRIRSGCAALKLDIAEDERQLEIMFRQYREPPAAEQSTVRSIPRRRLKIFEESEGKCHYCSTPLTLDGKWHIEHKMPKALMGSDEPSNLVASCVPCNMKKRDRTDVEFKAQRASV